MAKNTPKERNRKKQWAKDHPEARREQSKRAYARRKTRAALKIELDARNTKSVMHTAIKHADNIAATFSSLRGGLIRAHAEKIIKICDALISHAEKDKAAASSRLDQNGTAPLTPPYGNSTAPTTPGEGNDTAPSSRSTNNTPLRPPHAEGNYDPMKYFKAKYPQFADDMPVEPPVDEPVSNDIILGVMEQHPTEGNFAERYNAAIALIKRYPALTKIKYEKTVAS